MGDLITMAFTAMVVGFIAAALIPMNLVLTAIILLRTQKMATQEEFDAKVAAILAAVAGVSEAVEAEAEAVRTFIASLPSEIDTSALDGVVERLADVTADVDAIFEGDEEEEEEEEAQP